MSSSSDSSEAGWQLARRAVQLAINNQVDEALRLLRSAANTTTTGGDHRAAAEEEASLQAQAGLCFLTFMYAVMTFEDEKMSLALATFRATEKRCNSSSTLISAPASSFPHISGLTPSPSFSNLRGSMKNRVRGLLGGVTAAAAENTGNEQEEALRLERQIIAADCQVLEAIVSFLQQDWSSYMRGGWVLRKAWKVYQRVYAHIRQIYMREVGIGGGIAPPPLPATTPPHCHQPSESKSRLAQSMSMPLGFLAAASEQTRPASPTNSSSGDFRRISAPTIRRLMSAVSFGFGMFHLSVSLLPPKLLNIVHFLGFEGDRQTGIQALHFSRQGCDMRAPIATLALLWFHTIVRPFFGLDGSNLKSGADAAQRLIDASKADFAHSALFLFFQGRVERLKSNFDGALCSYETALGASAQREVRLLCLHEVGWSYVLLLQWDRASQAFLQLKQESRWSKSFYCYLSSVCLGSSGDIERCLELAQETPRLVRRGAANNNQLEKFLLRRANKMLVDRPDQNYCLLLAYELLYLWNALGACLKHSCKAIEIDCQRIRVAPLEGVRQLILGSIHSDSGHVEEAKLSYSKAIKQGNEEQKALTAELHAAAFAAYELGLLLCRDPETRCDGRRYLEFARDNYQNYDFESRLNVRIHAALRYHSDNANERFAQALISN